MLAPAFAAAREAAERLLRSCYDIEVAKALDPLKRRDFGVIERRLADAVAAAARGAEDAALREALRVLDVDWPLLDSAGRAAVLRAARTAAATAAEPLATSAKVESVLVTRGGKVVSGAKAAAAKRVGQEGRLVVALNAIDRRILGAVAFNQAQFVRDELGQRVPDLLQRKAKEIVANGLARGLGRESLKHELKAGLGAWTASRSDNYWSVVANSMANTARSYGALSTYREAGFTRYKLEAILDTRTTPQCMFIHGKTFDIEHAITNIETATPDRMLPWMYEGKDGAGNPIIYFKDRDTGERTKVADIERRGGLGDPGRFSPSLTDRELQTFGVDTPPFHAHCRTTVVVA